MTDNEIIKALEEELKTALTINHRFEESNDTENPDDHKFIALLSNTIKLINHLKAEIERLESNLEFVRGTVKRLREYDEERDIQLHARLTEKSRAEAIKEFAERLKAEGFKHKNFGELVYVDNIDDLVKEMVGE